MTVAPDLYDGRVAMCPWWARAYRRYKQGTPHHRGKRTVLRLLHRVGVRRGEPFAWRMKNDAVLAISPVEGFKPWSVGWTCFEQEEWEPHVERLLRRLLRPGDVALDVGANLGYFSAVMAQCVGQSGRVFSLEPVPATFRLLDLCARLNAFSQMTPLRTALGAAPGSAQIRYDPSAAGQASIHQNGTAGEMESVDVQIVRLDDLIAQGTLLPPRLIKVDVEGHERDVFLGAVQTLRKHQPLIIFEYNTSAAARAGWTLSDVARLLESCGGYRLYQIDAGLEPIDAAGFAIDPGRFVDLLATSRDLDTLRTVV